MFVDTSAILALLGEDQKEHARAATGWRQLVSDGNPLVTTNYVVLETISILQARKGISAVRTLQQEILPVLATVWIDESAHERAIGAVMTIGRRQLSLVDCASFDTMRRLGIRTAFTFDPHFAEQGFTVAP